MLNDMAYKIEQMMMLNEDDAKKLREVVSEMEKHSSAIGSLLDNDENDDLAAILLPIKNLMGKLIGW